MCIISKSIETSELITKLSDWAGLFHSLIFEDQVYSSVNAMVEDLTCVVLRTSCSISANHPPYPAALVSRGGQSNVAMQIALGREF